MLTGALDAAFGFGAAAGRSVAFLSLVLLF